MRLISLMAMTSMIAFFLSNCRATKSKKLDEPVGSNNPSGEFDENNNVNLTVPRDLNNFTPAYTTKTDADLKKLQQSAARSLGLLAPPVSSEGIEEIIYRCFAKDSDFIAPGWYFYAELLSGGEVIKEFRSVPVDQCSQVQLTLQLLDRTKTYEVKAMFYWTSSEGDTTVVWYAGQTEPFKPRDANRRLTLQKLRVDQPINVAVEKSEKDRCIFRDYLWNGYQCIDTFMGLSFVHADKTDYADAEAPLRRSCLTIDTAGKAVLYPCTRNKTRTMVRPQLINVQDVPPAFRNSDLKELGWFRLKFEQDGNVEYCLAAQRSNDGDPRIEKQPCTNLGEVPPANHLWNLIPLGTADNAASDSFKVVTQFDESVRCISVPPEKNAVYQGPSIRAGAPVRLVDCNTTDVNTNNSQALQFWNPAAADQ